MPTGPQAVLERSATKARMIAAAMLAFAGIASSGADLKAETSSWSASTKLGNAATQSAPVLPPAASKPRSNRKRAHPSPAAVAKPVARKSRSVTPGLAARDTQRLKQAGNPASRKKDIVATTAAAIAAGGDDPAYYAFDRAEYLTALALARKAAEKGEPSAFTLAGRIYAEGLGVPINLPLAAKWYQRAAEMGDTEASFLLGVMFAKGTGIAKNYDAAAQLIEAAARTGHPYANYNLALMFLSGLGKPENPYRAAQHMTYAAEKGIPAAQYDLAVLYQNGHGVPNDAYLASHWLKRAAELGMPEALFDYSVMLFKGYGINADQPRALEYLRAAARKGVPGAQNRLANLLAIGGPHATRDVREAAKWRLLAQSAGLPDPALDKVVARLPAADLLAAEQLAQSWRERAIVGAVQR